MEICRELPPAPPVPTEACVRPAGFESCGALTPARQAGRGSRHPAASPQRLEDVSRRGIGCVHEQLPIQA